MILKLGHIQLKQLESPLSLRQLSPEPGRQDDVARGREGVGVVGADKLRPLVPAGKDIARVGRGGDGGAGALRDGYTRKCDRSIRRNPNAAARGGIGLNADGVFNRQHHSLIAVKIRNDGHVALQGKAVYQRTRRRVVFHINLDAVYLQPIELVAFLCLDVKEPLIAGGKARLVVGCIAAAKRLVTNAQHAARRRGDEAMDGKFSGGDDADLKCRLDLGRFVGHGKARDITAGS